MGQPTPYGYICHEVDARDRALWQRVLEVLPVVEKPTPRRSRDVMMGLLTISMTRLSSESWNRRELELPLILSLTQKGQSHHRLNGGYQSMCIGRF